MVERQLSLLKGPRQRGIIPRAQASEFELQCAIVDTLRVSAKKDWYWTSIEHGGLKDKVTAQKHHRKGIKAGIPDLLFIGPDGGHRWLEIKVKYGRVSDEQEAFGEMLTGRGVPWEVVWSYDEAIAVLTRWGILRNALARGHLQSASGAAS
jgi:hypothetical protein